MKKAVLLFVFFSFIIPTHSQTADALVAGGRLKLENKKYPAAILDFSSAIKKNDAEVQKYFKKVDSYNKMSEFEKADKGATYPIIDKKYAEPFLYRGMAYSATEKKTEAMKDFDMAITIDPANGKAFYERGKMKWSSGNKEEACTDMSLAAGYGNSAAKDLFGENVCWQYAVNDYKEASARLQSEEYTSAFELIGKALKLCPDSVRYLIVRGRCYLGLAKPEKALADLDLAIKLSPNGNAEASYQRGMTFYGKENYQQAADDFSKAIQLNSKFTDAYLYRANSYVETGDQKDALADYDQAIVLRPEGGFAYFKRGLLKQLMKDKKGACKDLKKSVSLGYTEANSYVAAGCK